MSPSSTEKPRIVKFTVPKTDPLSDAWINAQSSVHTSLRMLIHQHIAACGSIMDLPQHPQAFGTPQPQDIETPPVIVSDIATTSAPVPSATPRATTPAPTPAPLSMDSIEVEGDDDDSSMKLLSF